jgi:dTDP-4-amino-4,6-dideoxygalactose transaminase
MQQPQIPVFKPAIDEGELEAARKALESGWLGMGSYVGAFEREIGKYIEAGERHVVAVSTGHAALHLAMLLAGIGPGDEVITPSFNNAADFQAILATGASPVFCDIDETTLCIDLDSAEQAVSRGKTKAIVVMDYDCVLCDHDRVASFARRHGLRVVHDAAHSFGSRYKDRMVGSFSDLAMFSFDPVKTITCIDGGALVVRTREEMERAHAMRLIGMSQPAKVMYQDARAWTYDVAVPGFRYHMANLHAAIGLAQLARIDAIVASRRRSCVAYNERLDGLAEVRVPASDFADVAPFLYYIRVPADDREPLREHLRERGVDTGIHWQPGHWFTLFKDCRRTDLAVTERVGREVLSLPLHSFMPEETLERVCTGVVSYFRSNR